MKFRLEWLAALLCASTSALAGNAPAGPMVSPVGAMAVPVHAAREASGADADVLVHVATDAGIKGDCLIVDGEVLSCFGAAAEMAKINRQAKQMAKGDPSPTPCLAHVKFVRALASKHEVYEVTSSMGGWGKEGTAKYDWAEVTGVDRSGWHLEKVASAGN